VNHDEVRLAQREIVEGGFQQQRVAAALTIETTGAFDAVNVYGETETVRLAREVIEKKILNAL